MGSRSRPSTPPHCCGSRGIEGVPPLRTTVHAGEDFVHLLTGLRRLDEAIRHLGLEEGDRIGHGMALGLDPTTWFERIGRVVQTREERLLDLVWEWNFYAKSHADVGSGRLSYLRSNIARLGEQVFVRNGRRNGHTRRTCSFDSGAALRTGTEGSRVSCREWTRDRRDPHRTGTEGDRWRRLLRGYLRSPQVWRKGRIPETITLRDLPHELRGSSQPSGCASERGGDARLDGRGKPFVQPPDR